MKFKLVIIYFLFFSVPSIFAFQDITSSTDSIKITADFMRKVPADDSLHAQGDVNIKYKDMVFTADKILYFNSESKIEAEGEVIIRSPEEMIKGKALTYNFDTQTGVVKEASAFQAPWKVYGKEIRKLSKEKNVVKMGSVTSCDYEKPHYFIKATTIVVYLKKRIIAYNAVFFVRGIPVFYLPIFYQSLKELKPEVALSIGHSDIDGRYGKLKVKYPFTHHKSLTVYVDHYDNRGLGFGLQYDYKDKDKVDGSLYGYRIEDRIAEKKKETLRINHMQKFSQHLKTFVNINYQNDQSFDDDFVYTGGTSSFIESGERVNSNIYSYSSINYLKPFYSVLFIWEREDNWDDSKSKYIKIREFLPSFHFSTNKNKLGKTNFFYKYMFSLINNYDSRNRNFYTYGATSFSLTRAFRFGRNITVTPTTGIMEFLDNYVTTNSVHKERYKTKLDNSVNLRYRMTRDIDTDFTYYYGTGLFNDRNTIYTHRFNFILNTYFFRGRLKIKARTGYDFNKITTRDLEKLDPLVSEMRLRLSKYMHYYVKHDYNFATTWTNSLQNIINIYPIKGVALKENITYLSSHDNILDTISTIRIRPNLKWKFDFSYRTDYNYEKNYFTGFKSKEFAIIRDLHCWEVKFSLREQMQIDSSRLTEYWITFSLKSLPKQKVSLYKDNSYAYDEWYDWDLITRD
ncbi:LPS-assembly protein LptD [bacterium]